ncbi:MAG: enoyl-CoA hydratase/isomerase family protein [Leucobacter sp.]
MNVRLQQDGQIATLVLDIPHSRNAITPEIARELIARLTELESDDSIRAIILRGSGGYFCAGGDLRNMPPSSRDSAKDRLETYADLISRIRNSRLPIVCAIEGTAAGIGVSLALACDVVLAARDAQILIPFSKLGLFPDGGLIPLLAERVGVGRAKALLLLAHGIPASEAAQMGLVDLLADPNDLATVAHRSATDLAERAPLSIRYIKQLLAAGSPGLESATQFEIDTQTELYFSEDFALGKKAFFSKGQAAFTGR